jgi:integrase
MTMADHFADFADFTDIIISKAGLKSLERAGERVRRQAQADDKARGINAENAVIGETRIARDWKHILENAAEELKWDVLDEYNSLVHTLEPREVLVGAAILDGLGPMPPKAVASKLLSKWNVQAAVCLRLGIFWGRLNFGQVPAKTITDQYWLVCEAIAADAPEKQTLNLSYTTVREDLLLLNRLLRNYAARWRLTFVPQVEVPKEVVRRDTYLTPDEAARLLWAARGRVWNRDTGTWVKVVRADGRVVNFIDELTLENDKGIGRETIVEIYSGLRSGAAVGMRWKPNKEAGWIDVDTGTIHRTGSAQSQTKKNKFPSSKMAKRLLQHARRWKTADMRGGFNHVIRKDDNTPYTSTLFAFIKIVENAGLDPEIVRHTFRHSLATWLAFIGVDQVSAAKLLGMSVGVLDRVYRHFAPASEDDAIAKLDDPASRRRLRTLTREPRTAQPRGARQPVQALPRVPKLLERIRKARERDGGAQ